MDKREKVLAEIRERLERADDGRLAFVLAFLRAGEREEKRRAAEGVGPYTEK